MRLARGAFWSLSGAISTRFLGLISSVIVARILGKSGFGELGIIQSTIGMMGTFAGFGLGMTATKFIAEYRTSNPEKAARIRALSSVFAWTSSCITALVLFCFSGWLASSTLNAPQLTKTLQISALYLLFSSVNGAQIGILSGLEAFKTIAKINFYTGFATVPVTIAGVYLAGVDGVVWAMVFSVVINWFLNHFAIRRECKKALVPYHYKNYWDERGVLWKFAIPALVSGLFFAPTEWAVNALLVNQPGGYSQMGIFNAAKQWHVLILYIPSALSNITLPVLSNLIGEGNKKQYIKVIIVNTVLLSGISLCVALPVAILSKYIMGAYGAGFVSGSGVLLLVCLYSVLWSANIVIGQVLWSTGSSVLAMILAVMRAVILVVSFACFTPRTAFGLALAYTITYVLQTCYQGGLTVVVSKKLFFKKASAHSCDPD